MAASKAGFRRFEIMVVSKSVNGRTLGQRQLLANYRSDNAESGSGTRKNLTAAQHSAL